MQTVSCALLTAMHPHRQAAMRIGGALFRLRILDTLTIHDEGIFRLPETNYHRCGLSVISTASFSRRSNCCVNFPSRPTLTVLVSNGAPLFLDFISATCALVSWFGVPKLR